MKKKTLRQSWNKLTAVIFATYKCIAVIIFVLKPHCYNNSEDNHGNLADHKYIELS